MSSWDKENYTRFRFVTSASGNVYWVQHGALLTLDSLRSLFDDPNLEPLYYTRTNPLVYNDTAWRFETQDFNRSDLSNPAEIHKVFPEATKPPDDTALWSEDELTYDHGRPLPKYYEYEYVVNQLLPTMRYYVGVTAFDFGSPNGKLPPKESNVLNSIVEAYAQTSSDTVEEQHLDAYVYCHPGTIADSYTNRNGNREL